MSLPSFQTTRLLILLAAMAPWLTTIWFSIHFYTLTTDIHLQQGQLAVSTTSRFFALPFRVAPTLEITGPGRPFRWWFQSYRSARQDWRCIPLWLPPIAAFALLEATRVLVRAQRRARNQCPRCAYNLRGLPPASPCPECGHTP